MRPAYGMMRLADFRRALSTSRELRQSERLPRPELEALQQRRLDAIVRHAAASSHFYGERFSGLLGAGPTTLDTLPLLTKAEMMERWDDLVTDPRLKRDELLEWVGRLERDDYYLGEFRVTTTSGSSGRKGLFVFDRPAWGWLMGMFLRQNATAGIKPRLPRRRIASLHGVTPAHMSRQCAASVSIGIHKVATVTAAKPVPEAAAELNELQPDVLAGYPSALVAIADEQLSGRLHIKPSIVITSSELRTPEMAARLREAFGADPYDSFASTEGLWGIECEHHAGLHLYEDTTLVENVDDDGRPVPPGEPGARVLVTSLFNRVQPLIRLELSDVMVLDPEPCPCGRTLIRARSIEGRTDDVIRLPGAAGQPVAVHPIQFGVISADPDVAEFQVVQHGARLDIRVVPRERVNGGLEERLRANLASRLAELGAPGTEIRVERVAALERAPGGKLQLIVADRGR